MKSRFLNIVFLFLFLLDIGYSFNQYYHVSIDGDLAWITVPATGYQQVRRDPLALGVLLENKTYQSPNRFFAHYTLSTYFKNVPLALHIIADPIDSVYLACAIAKTAIQILIICLLSAYICASTNLFKQDYILAALLVTPLFQASGFTRTLGVIDVASTYTFFYALPLGLLMCFFFPFYKAKIQETPVYLNKYQRVLLLLLILYLPLHGPLISPLVLLICPVILLTIWYIQQVIIADKTLLGKYIRATVKIPGLYLFYFSLFTILCLYSWYIGRNDAENSAVIPLLERYKRLPTGLYHQLTNEFGYPLLLFVLIVNGIILFRTKQDKNLRLMLTVVKAIAMFSIVYILLLPLGGYRTYRPDIIRYDTFMPITLGLIFLYGFSTLYLLNLLKTRKAVYIGMILVVSLFYTIADKPVHDNECERKALMEISNSKEKIIPLDCGCTIMSWGKITNYDDSKWNTSLLQHWGIINKEKFYYQK